MRIIRAGVIGTGFIGPAHIEALKRIGGVEVAAVASLDTERIRQLAAQHQIRSTYSDWKALVDDPEIEVIHNCTPNNLHYEINTRAVNAGKHVISEKPLTMTSRESGVLCDLVRKQGVVHAVNFNYRFYPLIQQARRMVQADEIGEVYLVHGHYLQDWLLYRTDYNWRLESKTSGASRAVADIGSHWCDLVQFVTGLKIRSVFADLSTVQKTRVKPSAHADTFKGKERRGGKGKEVRIDTEDAGVVMLRLENGAQGALTVSQVSAGRKNREWFEVDGSKKAIAWDQEEPNQLWIGHREKPNEILLKDPSLLDPEVRRYAHYPGGHPEGYPDGPKNLFMNVYEFIRSGKDPRKHRPDFPTFFDGHWENKIVDAVLKSHKLKRWIDV